MSLIKYELVGKEKVAASLRERGVDVRESFNRTILALGYKLQQHVVQDKLHGQVLNQRTGRLSGSIHLSEERGGHSYSVRVGTNVEYARIHEYGGTIHHPGGTAYFLTPGKLAVFVANASAHAATLPRTRPHTITMPQRSFLRSALRDMTPEIKRRLQEAVAKASKGEGQ